MTFDVIPENGLFHFDNMIFSKRKGFVKNGKKPRYLELTDFNAIHLATGDYYEFDTNDEIFPIT
jgi:hypothetical protein